MFLARIQTNLSSKVWIYECAKRWTFTRPQVMGKGSAKHAIRVRNAMLLAGSFKTGVKNGSQVILVALQIEYELYI